MQQSACHSELIGLSPLLAHMDVFQELTQLGCAVQPLSLEELLKKKQLEQEAEAKVRRVFLSSWQSIRNGSFRYVTCHNVCCRALTAVCGVHSQSSCPRNSVRSLH